VRHRWWDGARWVDWEHVPGAPGGARAVACSWIGDRLDVFVTGPEGSCWYAALR
jgi:phage terminase large subunit-like protein